MDDVMQALMGLLMAVLTAAIGFAVQWLRANTLNLVQERLGAGAARVAGQIVAKIKADGDVMEATEAVISAGVADLRARFPDTAGKLAPGTLAGMIVGELGKLGQAVAR